MIRNESWNNNLPQGWNRIEKDNHFSHLIGRQESKLVLEEESLSRWTEILSITMPNRSCTIDYVKRYDGRGCPSINDSSANPRQMRVLLLFVGHRVAPRCYGRKRVTCFCSIRFLRTLMGSGGASRSCPDSSKAKMNLHVTFHIFQVSPKCPRLLCSFFGRFDAPAYQKGTHIAQFAFRFNRGVTRPSKFTRFAGPFRNRHMKPHDSS
jgi:hypothetical protein